MSGSINENNMVGCCVQIYKCCRIINLSAIAQDIRLKLASAWALRHALGAPSLQTLFACSRQEVIAHKSTSTCKTTCMHVSNHASVQECASGGPLQPGLQCMPHQYEHPLPDSRFPCTCLYIWQPGKNQGTQAPTDSWVGAQDRG